MIFQVIWEAQRMREREEERERKKRSKRERESLSTHLIGSIAKSAPNSENLMFLYW